MTSNCRFRVWDYPVKEMYTNMFKVIKENSPVATAKEGFMRVQDAIKGDFAFIHDAATVRYEVRTNCDLKVIKSTRSCGLSNPWDCQCYVYPIKTCRRLEARSATFLWPSQCRKATTT